MDQELTLGTEAHKTEEQDQVPGFLTPGTSMAAPGDCS